MTAEILAVVTWVGTGLTAIGTAIAIWQACLARAYKEQIRIDIRKLNVMRSAERLRKALENTRKLPSIAGNIPRGKKTESLIESIKECFDEVLGMLAIGGKDEDIRENVKQAQAQLIQYEHGLNAKQLSADMTASVQQPIQEAVSLANDRILRIEGKA